MTVINKARQIIELEEGWRSRPYYCTEGYPTVGYGFKIGGKSDSLPSFELPKKVGDVWLEIKIDDICKSMSSLLTPLNDDRQAIIISMCYQMGIAGVLNFSNMWRAIKAGDFNLAAGHMLDSKWAKQTPSRANRHAEVMRTGNTSSAYTIVKP